MIMNIKSRNMRELFDQFRDCPLGIKVELISRHVHLNRYSFHKGRL